MRGTCIRLRRRGAGAPARGRGRWSGAWRRRRWRRPTRRSSRAPGRTSGRSSRPPTATPSWYGTPAPSQLSHPYEQRRVRDDEILRSCYHVQVRLGWHDSGTYDKNIEEWPQRGGADGSLRFDAELSHGANAGT